MTDKLASNNHSMSYAQNSSSSAMMSRQMNYYCQANSNSLAQDQYIPNQPMMFNHSMSQQLPPQPADSMPPPSNWSYPHNSNNVMHSHHASTYPMYQQQQHHHQQQQQQQSQNSSYASGMDTPDKMDTSLTENSELVSDQQLHSRDRIAKQDMPVSRYSNIMQQPGQGGMGLLNNIPGYHEQQQHMMNGKKEYPNHETSIPPYPAQMSAGGNQYSNMNSQPVTHPVFPMYMKNRMMNPAYQQHMGMHMGFGFSARQMGPPPHHQLHSSNPQAIPHFMAPGGGGPGAFMPQNGMISMMNGGNYMNATGQSHPGYGGIPSQPPHHLQEREDDSRSDGRSSPNRSGSENIGKHVKKQATLNNISVTESPHNSVSSQLEDGRDSNSFISSPGLNASSVSASAAPSIPSHITGTVRKLFALGNEPNRRQWLEHYLQFMAEIGKPLTAMPSIAKNPLDLFKLYHTVRDQGGVMEIVRLKRWKDIGGVINVSSSASAAFTLRKNYVKFLLEYECKYAMGGIDPAPLAEQIEAVCSKKKKKPPPARPLPTNENDLTNKSSGTDPEVGSDASNYYVPPPMTARPGPQQLSNGWSAEQVAAMDASNGSYHSSHSGDNAVVSMPGGMPVNRMLTNPGVAQGFLRPPNYFFHPQQLQHPQQQSYHQMTMSQVGLDDKMMNMRPPEVPKPPPLRMACDVSSSSFVSSDVTVGSNITSSSSSSNNNWTVEHNVGAINTSTAGIVTSKYSGAMDFMRSDESTISKATLLPEVLVSTCADQSGEQAYAQHKALLNQSVRPQQHPSLATTPINTGASSSARLPSQTGTQVWPPHPNHLLRYSSTIPHHKFASNSPSAMVKRHSLYNAPFHHRMASSQQQIPMHVPPYMTNKSVIGQPYPMGGVPPPNANMHHFPSCIPPGLSANIKTLGPMTPVHRFDFMRDITKPFFSQKLHRFPPDSVEASKPLPNRMRKLTHKDICPIDMWKLYMSLHSGLSGEITSSLDSLCILTYDAHTNQYFTLSHLPGLMDSLIDIFKHALKHMTRTKHGQSTESTNTNKRKRRTVDDLHDASVEKDDSADHISSVPVAKQLKLCGHAAKDDKPSPTVASPKRSMPSLKIYYNERGWKDSRSGKRILIDRGNLSDPYAHQKLLEVQAVQCQSLSAEVDSTQTDEEVEKENLAHLMSPVGASSDLLLEFDDASGEDSIFFTTNPADEAYIARCLCITTILRNFSSCPQNESQMATYSSLIELLARLLLSCHGDELSCASDLQTSTSWDLRVQPFKHWFSFLLENILVTLVNVSGHLNLSRLPESCLAPLLSGLTHWLLCESPAAQDSLRKASSRYYMNTSHLSPHLLSLEALSRLCVIPTNVDLLLSLPHSRLQKLFHLLAENIAVLSKENQIVREISLACLCYLAQGWDGAGSTLICQTEPNLLDSILAYLEMTEQKVQEILSMSSFEVLQRNPEIIGTSLDLLRKVGSFLNRFGNIESNLDCFKHHHIIRLLGLSTSRVLDHQVVRNLIDLLYKIPNKLPQISTEMTFL